jgi:hypothetical protein
MNERIDQLWGQALDRAVPETYTQLSHSQVLKVKQVFAELIVAECAEIADTERPNSVGCGYITKTNGMRIKEHFGVEE